MEHDDQPTDDDLGLVLAPEADADEPAAPATSAVETVDATTAGASGEAAPPAPFGWLARKPPPPPEPPLQDPEAAERDAWDLMPAAPLIGSRRAEQFDGDGRLERGLALRSRAFLARARGTGRLPPPPECIAWKAANVAKKSHAGLDDPRPCVAAIVFWPRPGHDYVSNFGDPGRTEPGRWRTVQADVPRFAESIYVTAAPAGALAALARLVRLATRGVAVHHSRERKAQNALCHEARLLLDAMRRTSPTHWVVVRLCQPDPDIGGGRGQLGAEIGVAVAGRAQLVARRRGPRRAIETRGPPQGDHHYCRRRQRRVQLHGSVPRRAGRVRVFSKARVPTRASRTAQNKTRAHRKTCAGRARGTG